MTFCNENFFCQSGCDNRTSRPTKFIPLSTTAVRDNISKIVTTADTAIVPADGFVDKDCDASNGYHRCITVTFHEIANYRVSS